jgi:hypothetical protein
LVVSFEPVSSKTLYPLDVNTLAVACNSLSICGVLLLAIISIWASEDGTIDMKTKKNVDNTDKIRIFFLNFSGCITVEFLYKIFVYLYNTIMIFNKE